MRINSPMEKKKYLHDLRQQMESWFAFGETRFTGLVLGNFLYITHHAGFEWNRRVTNEKSRAIGFVTRHGDGCEVHVICTRGLLDPVSLVLIYLLGLVYFAVRGMDMQASAIPHILAALTAVITGVISAVQCWFTERGQESMTELLTLLYDPELLWEDSEV